MSTIEQESGFGLEVQLERSYLALRGLLMSNAQFVKEADDGLAEYNKKLTDLPDEEWQRLIGKSTVAQTIQVEHLPSDI